MDKFLMIEKIGHSSDNIIEIQNVISKEDHNKLLLDSKNLKFLSGSKWQQSSRSEKNRRSN